MQNLTAGLRNAFISDGMLLPLWRAVLYFAIGAWVVGPVADRIWGAMAGALHIGTDLSAATIAFYEAETFAIAALLTGLLAWYERRRIDDYGLPVSGAFRGLFWEGLMLGIVWAGLDAGGMLALGGMKISGLALHGVMILTATLAWAGANVMVGVAEEFWYRSYFFKTGENLYDVVSLIGFGRPAWLTGGPLGTEASILQYPTTILAFVYVWLRFRRVPSR